MKLERTAYSLDEVYSSALEAGDYVPHFYIENDGRRLDVQVKAGAPLLLVFVSPWVEPQLLNTWLNLDFPCTVQFVSSADPGIAHPRLFWDSAVYRLFMQEDIEVGVYLCNANLKLQYVAHAATLEPLLAAMPVPATAGTDLAPPVLVVPDVITPAMAETLIRHFRNEQDKAVVNEGSYKSRQHLHPARELEVALDDKLVKSLLPELKKVFLSEISYRETYKICCYDARASGAFGKHRDTITPHLHRRYAMTLLLNDDYEGGGICFPEYNDAVVQAPKYAAVIFPGSLYHQVNRIGKGQRFVVVSFFFTEAEASLKSGAERYRFRVKRDICDIPINQLWPDSH